MKRIFLTLGVLFFAGGAYYIGQNYTVVQLDQNQMTKINAGLASDVFNNNPGSSEGSNGGQLVFRVGSFALLKH